ncbi:PREDICTED: three prime repair exonuclease 2 [Nanorana parkeri]|uniref:three prime repair exonuclease 2 n=1 Tax=Nanorana parkeri TaxID=125878 RepID=UPI0008550AB3|nr:PREDICTED: three prime repair exonuclease 2 [Nanorana parkeri]
MASSVKTFIFLDLEATGLHGDLPKITELCLVAVHVSSLKNPATDDSGETQLPRVMDKLCLCVDPDKPLTKEASEITGLDNEQLSDCEKKKFDDCLINTVIEFINRQAQPVCLVAHNGFDYDFPLLKTELLQQQHDLSSAILCMDSLQAFRSLHGQGRGKPGYVKVKFNLPEIFRRFFSKEPDFSHYAEGDVLTLILVVICKAESLLEAANYRRWGEIKPMY